MHFEEYDLVKTLVENEGYSIATQRMYCFL